MMKILLLVTCLASLTLAQNRKGEKENNVVLSPTDSSNTLICGFGGYPGINTYPFCFDYHKENELAQWRSSQIGYGFACVITAVDKKWFFSKEFGSRFEGLNWDNFDYTAKSLKKPDGPLRAFLCSPSQSRGIPVLHVTRRGFEAIHPHTYQNV